MKYIFTSLLFGALNVCSAQDSLVFFNELTFNSDLERQVFSEYFTSKSENYFALFFAINPDQSDSKLKVAKKSFDLELEKIKSDKNITKKPEKQIKYIYEEIHEHFFDQYLAENLFSDIFIDGKYNCVSATALYGLYFASLNIPFTIKERPTHVYAVAYPNNEQVLVEATDPQGGFIRFSDSDKSALINQLASAKLISSTEMRTLSTDQLFSKYYFSDNDISLKELIGIQYLNDAIYKLNKKDYLGAFYQSEKALMFYQSEQSKNLWLATGINYLAEHNYEDDESPFILAKLSRYTEIDPDIIIGEFGRMINNTLIEKGDADRTSEQYEKVISLTKNEELLIEFNYIYNYERGRILFNQARFKESLPFFELAYEIKPNNIDANNSLITSLIKSLTSTTDEEAVDTLEKMLGKYPSLKENNYFVTMLANVYLILFGKSFDLNKEKEGLRYKSLFERYYDPELSIDQNNLGRAYSIAAVYYFRKGYTSKAKAILNEGLNMSPHNHELLVRKNMIH